MLKVLLRLLLIFRETYFFGKEDSLLGYIWLLQILEHLQLGATDAA